MSDALITRLRALLDEWKETDHVTPYSRGTDEDRAREEGRNDGLADAVRDLEAVVREYESARDAPK